MCDLTRQLKNTTKMQSREYWTECHGDAQSPGFDSHPYTRRRQITCGKRQVFWLVLTLAAFPD